MRVAYASPNKSHHFPYAEGLHSGGILGTYIQGYPRFKGTPNGIPSNKLIFRDHLQSLFVPLYRIAPNLSFTQRINLNSKDWIDQGLSAAMRFNDIGVFYNGCGLKTLRRWKSKGKILICEAVNAHLSTQTDLLKSESETTGAKFLAPYGPEKEKRLAEYELADYILCPSSFVAESFIDNGISKKKIIINRYGVTPVAEQLNPKKESSGKFTILYVGSVNYRKGLRYLIEAFKKMKLENKELWIVGPTLPPTGIEDIQIGSNILMKGVLKGDDLLQAYQSASVFVQPSIEEGLSLVIGEALGNGLPVIATTNSGAKELFEDGECGFHVPIRDADQIFKRLNLLANQPHLIDTLSDRALQISKDFGGWKESQLNLVNQLNDLKNK